MKRTFLRLVICGAALGLAALFACAAPAEGTPPPAEGGTRPPPGEAGAGDSSVQPRREAGVPAVCSVFSGSTSSETCSCGENASPYTGASTDKCPVSDAPHYCLSYDVVDPPPLRRECTCQPKCLFQKVTGGGGEGGAGNVDTCRCGVSSYLLLGGQGSKDETRASCDGFAVCCRFGGGCDCTSDGSFTCPAGSQKVPSCGPPDFNEQNYKALVYGSPSYTDLIDVPRCR